MGDSWLPDGQDELAVPWLLAARQSLWWVVAVRPVEVVALSELQRQLIGPLAAGRGLLASRWVHLFVEAHLEVHSAGHQRLRALHGGLAAWRVAHQRQVKAFLQYP